eukprot:CAMPEP_0116960928 /NCGR_PEP_ID=MMETSP0467-20121206/46252_1 /TAXON_ID=283647 /ORGANISM="Mesodinium pulex, Strain SPMC105" /LENGTH=190 /DNA_ID=CAMNT_0004648749 /DNA_START=64 /DNA_END=636 /DNA_ORIENTATION=+
MTLFDKRPRIAVESYIAPSASVIGQVLIYGNASIWYGAVVRGDRNQVTIGGYTNVQDKAVIHCSTSIPSGLPAEVKIGSFCTIGHGAVLHSCTLKDRVLVGMNAVIQEGTIIEEDSMVAAGAVVLPETHIPSGQLWAGNPAKYVRDVTAEEVAFLEKSAQHYAVEGRKHQEEFLPYGTLYQQGELMGDTK